MANSFGGNGFKLESLGSGGSDACQSRLPGSISACLSSGQSDAGVCPKNWRKKAYRSHPHGMGLEGHKVWDCAVQVQPVYQKFVFIALKSWQLKIQF